MRSVEQAKPGHRHAAVVVDVVEVVVVDDVVVDDVVVLVGTVVVVVVVVVVPVVGHVAWRVIVTVSGPPLGLGKGFSLMLPAEIEQLTARPIARSPAFTRAETASTKTKAVIPIASNTTSNLVDALRFMASPFPHIGQSRSGKSTHETQRRGDRHPEVDRPAQVGVRLDLSGRCSRPR